MKTFGVTIAVVLMLSVIVGVGFYVHTQSDSSEFGPSLSALRVDIPDIPGLERKSPPTGTLDEVGVQDDEREVFNQASNSEENKNSSLVEFESLYSVAVAQSLRKPERNHIFACTYAEMADALSRPWLSDEGTILLSSKPVVGGRVRWDGSLRVESLDLKNFLSSRGVPSHGTGIFPIKRSSEAYEYDKNPNRVRSIAFNYEVPSTPAVAQAPSCLPLGPIGVMDTGSVLYSALDANLRDALAHEILDECGGHPQQGGQYHYHGHSTCFEAGAEGEHSPRVGYALDGFGIYGPRDENGNVITNDQLDECHGHIHGLESSNVSDYHYHINNKFPYTLGCFKGEIDEKYLDVTIQPIENSVEANLRSQILKLPPPAPGSALPRPEGTSEEGPEDL